MDNEGGIDEKEEAHLCPRLARHPHSCSPHFVLLVYVILQYYSGPPHLIQYLIHTHIMMSMVGEGRRGVVEEGIA